MVTYTPPPEKATTEELAIEIETVSNNPVVSGLLHSISGLLAVMDERRQIVALNDSLLEMMGFNDPSEVLGMRQGEALKCVYTDEDPKGCGHTKYCSSCGAAIAIVTTLGENAPAERMCALKSKNGNKEIDLALLVKSHPIQIENKKFLLLFLQDITLQEQRAALERTFFHDINNMIGMLVGGSELLKAQSPSPIADMVFDSSVRLMKEVEIQSLLSQNQTGSYQPLKTDIPIKEVLEDLDSFSKMHKASKNKEIEIKDNFPDISINTDISLLSRILYNMTLNALEATPENDTVKIWTEKSDNGISFCVWNSQVIPEENTYRIFQRNFSTKAEAGRGIGTYSMKLFGEDILGGTVTFETSKEKGTTFRFTHPV